MAVVRGPKRKVRRTVSPHRKTTVKYGQTYSKRVRPIKSTGPKKVRKAPQVHRPRDDVRNRGSPFMHGAAYGVSQGKSGRLSQQKFRHLTVKAAKILGYPQSQNYLPMKKAMLAGGHRLPPRRDGSGRLNRLGLTEYEKLALAVAEGKGLLK